jgi:serine protease Do
MWWRTLIVAAAAAFAGASAPVWAQSRFPTEGFADLAERLTPAVVNVATRQAVEGADAATPPDAPLPRFEGGQEDGAQITSLGSGFLISADGVIVTNNHVIEAADAIEIILQDGQRYNAVVVGRDTATDIAVLRISAPTPLPYVQMGDSDNARVGDIVLAIGNPFGLGGSLSVGVVSARNRNFDAGRYDDFIQTDAAINRGNSGGPLFNTSGEVIGINTAILTPNGASVGVGFATPTSIARPVVEQLLQYGETRRGWLGVRLANVTLELARRANYVGRRGAVVTRVTPNGPAAYAGLRNGDIVLSFDGNPVADSRSMIRMVGDSAVGAEAAIEIVRDGRIMTLNAVVGRLQEGDAGAGAGGSGPRSGRMFGIMLSDLDAGLREEFQIDADARGVAVVSVEPGSGNERVLQPGDVIEAIGFLSVRTLADARFAFGRAEGQSGVIARVDRDGATTYRRLSLR